MHGFSAGRILFFFSSSLSSGCEGWLGSRPLIERVCVLV